MRSIHGNKLGAVMEMKLKALFSKNFIIMPIFSVGIAVVMKFVYGSMMDGNGMSSYLTGMALSLGVLMNISMTGIYCVSAAMAEEKEKHTLRVLMTSSVNGLEFFLGSIIPVILMITLVNIILVPFIGVSMHAAAWGMYIGISLLSSVSAAVIGMVFGIFSKDQVTAGTITTPVLLVLMMIPIFAQFNETAEKISGYLFTGVMKQAVDRIAAGETNLADAKDVAVTVVEVVLSVICFLAFYRKNGYDAD